ncbi:sensor histidine kinase [Pengzhenrongella phosphoraccumulans]|uniref:sensor histidine kinase n=1 Tax=Pengzhenrongella phosphoraccumulans TaxID=3114394 RepID=UPI00388D7EEE
MNDPVSEKAPPRWDLYYPWLAIAAVCTALMWVWPGEETIPYHVAWASFALLYGLGDWRLRRAATGLVLYTIATGAVLVVHAATGLLVWQETTEIPLMSVLMVLAVWSMRRRQHALAAVTVMADRERAQALDRERLTRLTSHELRTPLTIARGYVELLLERELDPQQRRDLAVVDDELDRLTRVTERLVRVIRLQGGAELERVDLDVLLSQTVERWAQVADRRWVVDARAGAYDGSAERLRACLDTLIENALRYTRDGDTVRLSGHRDAGWISISVADSGPGLSQELIAVINGEADGDLEIPRDELSQTGLGLGLVRGVVNARGGHLRAGTAAEGGAQLWVEIPVTSALGRFAPDAPSGEDAAAGPAGDSLPAGVSH